jgi:hypothetical protein
VTKENVGGKSTEGGFSPLLKNLVSKHLAPEDLKFPFTLDPETWRRR